MKPLVTDAEVKRFVLTILREEGPLPEDELERRVNETVDYVVEARVEAVMAKRVLAGKAVVRRSPTETEPAYEVRLIA